MFRRLSVTFLMLALLLSCHRRNDPHVVFEPADDTPSLELVSGPQPSTPAREPRQPPFEIPDEFIITSFSFQDGFIGLPVIINAQPYLFMLDTGSTFHVLDQSLRGFLDEPCRYTRVRTAGGISSNKWPVYRMPTAQVGSLSIKNDEVVVNDFQADRDYWQLPVCGIIGVRFFKNRIVHIDFESHKLVVLKPEFCVPPAWGKAYKLETDPKLLLRLFGTVGGSNSKKTLFAIDTGSTSFVNLEKETFYELVANNEIRDLHPFVSTTALGEVPRAVGRLSLIQACGGVFTWVPASESSVNALGLRFLENFQFTFDVDNRRVYIAKRRSFHSQSVDF